MRLLKVRSWNYVDTICLLQISFLCLHGFGVLIFEPLFFNTVSNLISRNIKTFQDHLRTIGVVDLRMLKYLQEKQRNIYRLMKLFNQSVDVPALVFFIIILINETMIICVILFTEVPTYFLLILYAIGVLNFLSCISYMAIEIPLTVEIRKIYGLLYSTYLESIDFQHEQLIHHMILLDRNGGREITCMGFFTFDRQFIMTKSSSTRPVILHKSILGYYRNLCQEVEV
ncbi:uncharacterized protein LOC111640442 [Centruroides sculpturatus]|uniref:uncharacterized protein LOC111640442 n=1 Tax=Centruroides sculpturatus TaxID=218467 RepID=UPI000C6E1A03|nr:uncharacterized protein LOC111640442 [Centruroides sculpturatus]